MRNKINALSCFIVCFFLMFTVASAQNEDEDTYSISLVQTAEINKEIVEIDEKKILTETYTIQKGDHLWQILRSKGLLEKPNFGELLNFLKKLNSSYSNLDIIHPDEQITIPLVIAPRKGAFDSASKTPKEEIAELLIPEKTDEKEEETGGEEFKLAEKERLPTDETTGSDSLTETLDDIDLAKYRVVVGDSLIKIIKSHYKVPIKNLHDEYLQLVRKLNPDISDINFIYPGQVIKLPIFSPQVVRMPIETTKEVKEEALVEPEIPKDIEQPLSDSIRNQISQIVTLIGEGWEDTGQHFIPLKSAGQIDLKADKFPIINLVNGNRVIIDLNHELPERISNLIISHWKHYRIVHIEEDDDLYKAFEKIFPVCGYAEFYDIKEPLELESDTPVTISADWIIKSFSETTNSYKTTAITLIDDISQESDSTIMEYLKNNGVSIVEYPLSKDYNPKIIEIPKMGNLIEVGGDYAALIEKILNEIGQKFTRDTEISIFQSRETDFNVKIRADFYLDINGNNCIIDYQGLEPDIFELLKEHEFSILALSKNDENLLDAVSKVLDFTGTTFTSGPHDFFAANRDVSKNIKISVPGIIFKEKEGNSLFFMNQSLSQNITQLILSKGYQIIRFDLK